MYNCIYDCRYCFLQGMFSSANYLVFVNYEDFYRAIKDTIKANAGDKLTFYSGYDCDSLAFEKVTGFAGCTIPFFSKYSGAEIEFRTKRTGKVIENLARTNNLKFNSIVCETIHHDRAKQFGQIEVPLNVLKEKMKFVEES